MGVKSITVFQCPYFDECHNSKEYLYSDAILEALTQRPECKAPFLFVRETGENLCKIMREEGRIIEWKETIKEIGRRRG